MSPGWYSRAGRTSLILRTWSSATQDQKGWVCLRKQGSLRRGSRGSPLPEHKAEQSLLGEGGLAFREILELLWFADLRVSGPELMEGLAQRSRLRKTAGFGELWHCQQKKATQSK